MDFDLVWPSINPRLTRGILVFLVEKGTSGAPMPEQVVPHRSRCSRDPMERRWYFWVFQGLAYKSRVDKIRYQHSHNFLSSHFSTPPANQALRFFGISKSSFFFFFPSYLHIYVSIIVIVILNTNSSDLKDTALRAFTSSYSLWVPSLVRMSLMRLASSCVRLWVYRLCWVVYYGCENLWLKM